MKHATWLGASSTGVFPDTQGWNAEREGADCTCTVALHKDGKVAALVVSEGGYFETEREVKRNASFIVRACNAHDELVKALQAIADPDTRYDATQYFSGVEYLRHLANAALAKVSA